MDLTATVSTLMTKKLVTLKPNASLQDAQDIFNKMSIHHIPVTIGDKLVGMLSKTDMLYFVKGFAVDAQAENDSRLESYKVRDIMTEGMAKLGADDRINVALDIFKLNIFHALPVVDENDNLVGIFTTHDIIKQLSLEDDDNIKKGLN